MTPAPLLRVTGLVLAHNRGTNLLTRLIDMRYVNAFLGEYKDKFAKHPGLQRERGHLGLQSHDGRVEFRALYVKPL